MKKHLERSKTIKKRQKHDSKSTFSENEKKSIGFLIFLTFSLFFTKQVVIFDRFRHFIRGKHGVKTWKNMKKTSETIKNDKKTIKT